MNKQRHILPKDFCCAPLGQVRVAFIGLGRRGLATLRRFMAVDHLTVTALCDVAPGAVADAARVLEEAGRPRALAAVDLTELFARKGVADLAVVSTDWCSHASIARMAMEAGMHVAVEVPLALTVDECRHVVSTAELTRRHCFMMENCCFDPFALRTLEMARQGVFGQVVHCEGAYIHDLRKLYAESGWYGRIGAAHGGNPYPTHGLGPVCQLLDVGGGDRLERLVSMTSSVVTGCAPINTTLIHTRGGATVTLHHDVSTPQPYSRLQSVSGTRGYIAKYPLEICCRDGHEPLTGVALERFMAGFGGEIERRFGADADRLGVDNRMNYFMDRHLIDSLADGRPMAISVYDAALWSSVAELSERSARGGSIPLRIPDFTLTPNDIF